MKKHLLAGFACAIACLIFLALFVHSNFFLKPALDGIPEILDNYQASAKEVPAEKAEDEKEYVSPIPFESLQTKNPDIYAWIDIPDTQVSYPVVQREDDTFYLNHDITRQARSYGAIFTESRCNGTDFSDPVTVIYGHHMFNGTMFGSLQQIYWDADSAKSHAIIHVYTPQKELRYAVFLASQYGKSHLLIGKDYSDPAAKRQLVKEIRSTRQIGGYFDEAAKIDYEKPFLILSTCLNGNPDVRCLVVAQQIN